MDLPSQIELYLLSERTWVPTEKICAKFSVNPRVLRQAGKRPGMLDQFAVSSTRQGQHGYCHHRYITDREWISIKHRMLRHAIAELRTVRRWINARKNCLTGLRPERREKHTNQLLLFQ